MSLGRIEIPLGNRTIILETGKLAKQAGGAVTVTCGETIVLVTACMANQPRGGIDFFPLMVEYQEKTYSAGRIPGGFFKREGRPTEKEILTSRVIDRPIRPLFPDGMYNDVQVVATVLSSDGENDPDTLAMVGASAALMISDIPFDGPIGGVRIGLVDDEFVVNPTYAQREDSPLDLMVVGRGEQIVMIEGEADQISEDKIKEALDLSLSAMAPLVDAQIELQKQAGKAKKEVALRIPNEGVANKVKEMASAKLAECYAIADKDERQTAVKALFADVTSDMSVFDDVKGDVEEVPSSDFKEIFEKMQYDVIRGMIINDSKRTDGRGLADLRDISCEVGVLPRTHGASLFTRGQTQSLSVVTLGTKIDEQLIESLGGKGYRTFMLHYNFPSFSVGEARPMRGPGRREIGHGALASKSLKPVLPTKDEFPYTVRLVSEILESNGSSSMASVCAGSLALMEAGVPIKDAVAGISIGLITDEQKSILITDILGLEDHYGDMDFKVAGTKDGVTAIQLDLKIKGISVDLLAQAMVQSKQARLDILKVMDQAISTHKDDVSPFAPRIETLHVAPDKIGGIIGPGGKMIRKIIEETGVESIDIEDDGTVRISAINKEALDKALAWVGGIVEEPEVGKIYDAKVVKIMNFGAFCEFMPGKDGLVHVSELSNEYVKDVTSVVKDGDEFKVKLLDIDDQGRFRLSKKQAEPESEPEQEKE